MKNSPQVNTVIPWLIVVPFILITMVMVIGREDFKHATKIQGRFELPKGTKKVTLVTDVGNVTVAHGGPDVVTFDGATFLATGSQEQLDSAKASPFTLHGAPGDEPGEFVISVSPLPEGFLRLPARDGDEKDQASPRLLRQMDVRLKIPLDVELDLTASQGAIGVSSRQATTKVAVEKGDMMLQSIIGKLTVENGGGDTIVDSHRGPLEIESNGKTRITLTDLVADIDVRNAKGELDLVLPVHASCRLDAHSLTGNVRNSFGLKAVEEGKGTRTTGAIGDGKHTVKLVAEKGTLTVKGRKRSE